MSTPGTEEPVQFASQIKPLFRPKDRQSMLRHFDLGSYEDVSAHADRILARGRLSKSRSSNVGFGAASCRDQ
jgi:hypothetical protein